VEALASIGGENGAPRELGAGQLEVAVLDRRRRGRAFRRIAGAALTTLLEGGKDTPDKELGDAGASADAAAPAPGPETPTVSAASADLEGKPADLEGKPAAEGGSTGDGGASTDDSDKA
jgi:proteasome alpha subunit